MTRSLRPGFSRSSWLRLPKRSARLRLTMLSGALFLLSGVSLLVVAGLLFDVQSSQAVASAPVQNHDVPAPSSGGRQNTTFGQSTHVSHQSIGSALRAGASAQGAADRHDLLAVFAFALLIVAAFAVLLGWFVAGRMLRPLRTITATARRISATNLQERLDLRGADEEFKELGDTLDDLFARLAAAFEAQQHFVANASHELRTPLTAERALLQVALDDPGTTNDAWRSTAKEVLASSDEQERLIEALLTLASSEGGLDHRELVDLPAVCDGVLQRAEGDVQGRDLHVDTVLDPASLDGDPKLVERLVANLVDNAVFHNLTGGYVRVATARIGAGAALSVSNTGPLVPPGDIDRLFLPFQRLGPQRTRYKDGHGLGLSIVRAIASAHGATVTAWPLPGGGLSVLVTFPPGLVTFPPGLDTFPPGLDGSVSSERGVESEGFPASNPPVATD